MNIQNLYMVGRLEMLLNFRLSKRGDISVAVMVVLTLVLFVYILAAMSSDLAKLSANFNDVSDFNEFYSRQQSIETTLYIRLVEISLNSYVEMLNENSMNIGGNSNLDLNSIFRAKVEKNFKNVNEATPAELKKLFESVDLVSFDGKNINIAISNMKVEENLSYDRSSDSKIYYSPVLNTSFNFNRVGLPSFDELVIGQEKCSEITDSEENLLICLKEEFPQFSVSFNRVVPGQVHLVSLDSYYLNKKMDLIAFNLMFTPS